MAYVNTRDYLRVIQPKELNAITKSDITIRKMSEGAVMSELNASLIQEFDTDSEFKDLAIFSMLIVYKGNDRVYLDADAYSATATYALNALTLESGNVYVNTTPIVTPEAFAIGKWDLLGIQFDLFYVTLPNPLFDSRKFYHKDDVVFWEDNTYIAQQDSIVVSQQDALQAANSSDVNLFNPVPGTLSGENMWGTATPYSVAAGTLPTDTTKWTFGDNRNQMFVDMFLDMVVYKLSKRIAPDNVPEARHNAWITAQQNLKRIASGNINAQLPVKEPLQGNRIRWGGSPREINSW